MALLVYGNKSGRGSFVGKLARGLGVRSTNPGRGAPAGSHLLNWGCSATLPGTEVVGNDPDVVAAISNKLRCFEILRDDNIPTVEWTASRHVAQDWLDEGSAVYERHLLRSHSGNGIAVKFPGGAPVAQAPLYTRKIRGRFAEYRIHVVAGNVIAGQRKRRMTTETLRERGMDVPEDRLRNAVRTYANGWAFTQTDADPGEDARNVCIAAMDSVGAISGCVDIAVTERRGQVYVIEINSAPALRSPTIYAAYVEALRPLVQEVANG